MQEVISNSSVLQPHTVSVVQKIAVLQEVQMFRPNLPKLAKFRTEVHSRFSSDLNLLSLDKVVKVMRAMMYEMSTADPCLFYRWDVKFGLSM